MKLTSAEIAQDLARLKQISVRHQAADAPLAVGMECVRGESQAVFTRVPDNLAGVYQLALEAPELPFLIYQQERFSYGETYRYALLVAGALARDGIAKGDRVGICSRNNPQWCVAYMAITMIGAIVVPLNAWWQSAELLYAIRDSGCRLLFADPRRIGNLQPLLMDELDQLQLVAIGADNSDAYAEANPATKDLTSMVTSIDKDSARALVRTRDVQPDDDACIMYTSGSTDQPKGVLSTHRAIISAIYSWLFVKQVNDILRPEQQEPNPEFQPGILANVPLFHVTGSHAQFLASFLYHRKFVMMYKWNAEEALALIERERLSIIHGIPTMTWEIMNSPRFEGTDLRSLRTIHGGGAPRPPEHLALIRRKFPAGTVPGLGYGLTETNGLGAIITGSFYDSKPRSTGRPVGPLTFIRIVDEKGQPLGHGEIGEICIRGPSVMKEYWNRPQETREALRNGWFHTGDLGMLDEQGFLFVQGRIKDIIIRGGENIACADVEYALASHPDVLESAVFGLPDERLGEIVGAAAVLRPDAAIDEAALQRFLRDLIAHYKIPSRIWVQSDPLPRIASGKINRRQIRATCLHQRVTPD